MKSSKFGKGRLTQSVGAISSQINDYFCYIILSENLKEKTTIFRNCNFFGQSYFLHSGNQVFAYHTYTVYLYIKKACLHNLCMNRASLDRESLDRVSWSSTTHLYGLYRLHYICIIVVYIDVLSSETFFSFYHCSKHKNFVTKFWLWLY